MIIDVYVIIPWKIIHFAERTLTTRPDKMLGAGYQSGVNLLCKQLEISPLKIFNLGMHLLIIPLIKQEKMYDHRFQRTDQWMPVYAWLESLDTDEVIKSKDVVDWLTANPEIRDHLYARHSRYHLMHYIKKCHVKILKRKEKQVICFAFYFVFVRILVIVSAVVGLALVLVVDMIVALLQNGCV